MITRFDRRITMSRTVFSVTVLAVLTAPCSAHVAEYQSTVGVHCVNFTALPDPTSTTHSTTTEYHHHCVHCLFAQNCLPDNSCLLGSTGDTCEKCETGKTPMTGYYRVGNMCTECPAVAWPAVAFGVYLLLFIVFCFHNGFTASVSTKLKLLCHFLQLLVLTLHIKVDWPTLIVRVVSVVNLAEFNSNILLTACAYPHWKPQYHHYLQWLTSLMIPLLVFMLGSFIDSSMRRFLTKKKIASAKTATVNVPSQKKRTPLRRLVFLVLVVMYMPVTVSAIHTCLCSDTIPAELVLDHSQNIFLMDNSIPCDTFVFQTFHFILTLGLMVYVVAFPMMLVLFTLRQRKWKFLTSGKYMYGPAYESYKDRYCFWEVIPLLRKLVSTVVSDAYPIRPFIQAAIQLGMTGLYLLVIMLLRPYRCFSRWPVCWCHRYFGGFWVGNNLSLGLVQMVAVVRLRNIAVPLLPEVAVAGVIIVLLVWIVMMFSLSCEDVDDAEDEEIPETSVAMGEEKIIQPVPVRRTSIFPVLQRSRKVGPDPKFVLKVEQNKQKMEF